jgi:hypothetical protein
MTSNGCARVAARLPYHGSRTALAGLLTLIHLVRKVLLRVSSYTDYIIIKHAIGLH